MAIIEFPYVFVRVVLFLIVVIPILAISVVWLLVRSIFVLPRAILITVASKTSLTAGSHVPGSADPAGSASVPAADPDDQLSGDDLAALTAGAVDQAAALWLLREQSLVGNDVDLVRPAMTEGFWRLHCMLLDVRSGNGVERVFDGQVVDAAVVSATHSGIVDEVKVRLTCEGTCYDRMMSDGLILRGDPASGRWREEVALRRSATMTGMAAGPIPTTCPNCGARLAVNPDGSCRTCHTLVAGRSSDWVLDDTWRERW